MADRNNDGIDYNDVKKFAKITGVNIVSKKKAVAVVLVLDGIVAHYKPAKESLSQKDFEEYKKVNAEMLDWFNKHKEYEDPEEDPEQEEYEEPEPEEVVDEEPEQEEAEPGSDGGTEDVDQEGLGEVSEMAEAEADAEKEQSVKEKEKDMKKGKPKGKPKGKAKKDLAKTKDGIKKAKAEAEKKKAETAKKVDEKGGKKKRTGVVKFVCDGLKDGSFKGMKNEEIAEFARKKFDGSRLSAPDVGTCKRRVRDAGAEVVV